jgi:hypothetical protein
MSGGKCKLGQRFALVVADDQSAVLESPLAAGEKLSRTAALGRDRALIRARRAPEIHEAAAGACLAQLPAPAKIHRRWGWGWRKRRRGSGGSFRWGRAIGTPGERRQKQSDNSRAYCLAAASPWTCQINHRVQQSRNCLSKSTPPGAPGLGRPRCVYFMVGMTNSTPSLTPDGQRAVTVFVLV